MVYDDNIQVISIDVEQFQLKSNLESCSLHNGAKGPTVTDVMTAQGQGQGCNLLEMCSQM